MYTSNNNGGFNPSNNSNYSSLNINGYTNTNKFSNNQCNPNNPNNIINDLYLNRKHLNDFHNQSQRNQHINQNYVVNNYCNYFILKISLFLDINQPYGFAKNNPGNNFNNLFNPEQFEENNEKGYGVVNNNYYYGPFTNINKLEVDSSLSKNNSKSSNMFNYEDPCLKNLKPYSKINSNAHPPFLNINVTENLNNSTTTNNNYKGVGTTLNNNTTNSLFVSNLDYPTSTHEKKENDNCYKDLGLNLGYSAMNTSHLNMSGNRGGGKYIIKSKLFNRI